MLTSVRSVVAATLLAGTAMVATPAFAQDMEVSVSGNASIVSEYRFRGVDLSGGDIAIQGGIDVGLPGGFYVGTWASSLDEDTVGFGHTELDVYAGWSGEVTSGLTADVGALFYLYPNAGPGDFDYYEFLASVTAAVGPAEVTVGVGYSPEQDSLGGQDNFYVYTDLGVGIPETPISLSAHLGYTDGFLTYTTDGNAFDWSVGAEWALNDNLAIGVSYVGAEGDIAAPAYDFVDDAVVGSITVSF